MNKIIIVIAILAVIVIVGYYLPTASSTGTLRLQITDAPAALNVSSTLVTISKVEVHLASETNESENESTSWFTVVEGPVQYDLIAIKDVKEVLGSKDINVGKYTQVRLTVDKATATIDGIEYNLTIPSEKIKLIQRFDIEANKTTTLTLDFDAAESIKSSNNKYIMNPTIKIIQE